MKRQWISKRQLIEREDGQRRWDVAYQLLMQWSERSGEPEDGSEAEEYPDTKEPCG
jgi:hypothetical protein